MEFNVRTILNNLRAATDSTRPSNKDLRDIFDYYVLPRDRDIATSVYNAVLWDVYEGHFIEELKAAYINHGYVDTYINQFNACLMNDEEFRRSAFLRDKISIGGYDDHAYSFADFCRDLSDEYNDFKIGVMI